MRRRYHSESPAAFTSVDIGVGAGGVDAYMECIRQKEGRSNHEGLKQQSRRPSDVASVASGAGIDAENDSSMNSMHHAGERPSYEGLQQQPRRPSDVASVVSDADNDVENHASMNSIAHTDDRASYETLQAGPLPPQNSLAEGTSVEGSVGDSTCYVEHQSTAESATTDPNHIENSEHQVNYI